MVCSQLVFPSSRVVDPNLGHYDMAYGPNSSRHGLQPKIRLLQRGESQRRSNSVRLRHNIGFAQAGVTNLLGSEETGRDFLAGEDN
jgi:hypothetical protein